METTKNPYLRTHIAIIKALLDGSKKTQNQIAKETNYEKSTISHALDYLENKKKVIIREPIKKESGYTNKGNYNNKLCWLTYEVDNGTHVLEFLREILNKDTSFITDLQKSDKIIKLIFPYIMAETNYNEILYPEIFNYIPDMVRLSPTFFKNFLKNESYLSSFGKIWEEMYVIKDSELLPISEYNNIDCMCYIPDHDLIIFEAFNHSVIDDYINGCGKPEALKLILTLKKEKLNISYGEK
ncbi:MAG: winged helix-turn-helix domain-containing protein [Euryarchaeota archaeon]|nr:winged helix-turn-helix domain-containing protein [Euryarchaeota archaeon]MCG2737792.1 winged helix-turn-helix domain-containing protein [Candidatus Methanoperedenaceae archaeon]